MKTFFTPCFFFFFFLFVLPGSYAQTAEEYVDMPINTWLGLSKEKQINSVIEITSRTDDKLTRMQAKNVSECMNGIGTAPQWVSMGVDTLITKCMFEHQMVKTPHQDMLLECIRKTLPDFSKDEFLSLSLSAMAAALAKDSDEFSLTPRNEKALLALETCETEDR